GGMKGGRGGEGGRAPIYGDFNEPAPAAGESRVVVTAAALSPVVKARASGTHYSASGGYPIGVGIDGVGRLDDGSLVNFFPTESPLWQHGRKGRGAIFAVRNRA